MKIVDDNNRRILSSVTLLLTPAEARELADSARDLADHPERHHHHVDDADYQSQITVVADTPQARQHLHPQLRQLLDDDS